MAETIKKNDFIEVEYTGTLKEEKLIFDTTSEKVAKENHIFNSHAPYGPSMICVGQHQLLPGLDKNMEGKEIGKEYTFDLTAEEGFGKKSAQLLKLYPLNAFKEQKMMPEPGMQVEIDGHMGLIKTVTGGRVIVDFNHPLASKELVYTIKAVKKVTDDAAKIQSLFSLTLNIKKEHIEVSVKEGKAHVKMMKLPDVFQKEFEKKIKEVIPTIKEVVFEEKKQEHAGHDHNHSHQHEH